MDRNGMIRVRVSSTYLMPEKGWAETLLQIQTAELEACKELGVARVSGSMDTHLSQAIAYACCPTPDTERPRATCICPCCMIQRTKPATKNKPPLQE